MDSGLSGPTMTHLKLRIDQLEPKDRLVNLAMDEVNTAQTVEFSGGRIFGAEYGPNKTLFCTHINSVAGEYEDIISMLPVVHITKPIME